MMNSTPNQCVEWKQSLFFLLITVAIAAFFIITFLTLTWMADGSTIQEQEWEPPAINIETEKACLQATGSLEVCIKQRRNRTNGV
ncbi:MAG: hypothetical protein HYV78_02520 [Candidatus Wildermuthbacteria bacterium]|nr:hypothetical protein [Candidatus Wildermuthbacteria bacterium]